MRTVVVGMCVVGLALAVFVNVALGGARSEDDLEVAVSPQTLILDFPQGGAVKVHTDIPFGSVYLGEDLEEKPDPTFLELNGIPAKGVGIDSCGDIIGLFDEKEIEYLLAEPGTYTLTLTGFYEDGGLQGESFSGSDTVRVIEKK
jgi:hypothetical protein